MREKSSGIIIEYLDLAIFGSCDGPRTLVCTSSRGYLDNVSLKGVIVLVSLALQHDSYIDSFYRTQTNFSQYNLYSLLLTFVDQYGQIFNTTIEKGFA